ncbi:MAG: prolipoprotein diacylglyceryl transferase [Peptostreptococcaceae bacterium]|nr:prolipoprotein diacylglyceryl transferase [Peptostreptococcaceae bacterium]
MSYSFFSNLPVPNPVAFTIFSLDVMWYGVLIATGIILATILVYYRAPMHGIDQNRTLDFVLICLPIGIIGARAYYVFFEWDYYTGNIYKIINIREGGLAIHGGLIFGMLAAAILCIIWKIRPLNLLDLVVPAIALAQSIGRWGNYFNSEAHGGPTSLPWGIIVNGEMVHPTFLYESIWCFILFIILLLVDNRRKFEGQVFLLYGILYSIERFFVEWLRTDSLMLGSLKQAQMLSLSIIVVFSVLYILLNKKSGFRRKRRY